MRIQYKGGVWKNSEDEILKVAVMKYGKNQWARIASLLVRKSAKQCKARWFEWLDPAIKKTQWTREEEEKLLHLAKIFPTSWRTIAPMIGRTAAQCLEHYEKLLDQAQRGTDEAGTDGAGPSSAGGAAGRPRPGDTDAAPETKPARPDPVDMDEDELEMLSEARARLANTKGKKAKRKAREKQLEAAKRLAQLQKRRELKAAGIEFKPRRKNRKVTDYATEIPFERTPVPGFYDTTEEDDRVAKQSETNNQIGKLLQKYKGKTEEEKEEEARKKDSEKRKRLEKVNLPAALGLEKKLTAPRSPPLKKSRLSLPAPQVSDFELEKIAKAGAFALRENGGAPQTNANELQSRDGNGSFVNSVASTPQTSAEPWATVRQRHLETIVNLKSAETPLRGGENTSLPQLGLDGGVTPMPSALPTPNPLATPISATHDSHSTNNAVLIARARKEKLKMLQETVRKGLQGLPEPENKYHIEVDEELLHEDDRKAADNDEDMVEDAEEEERRNQAKHEKEIELHKERLLSSAAKRRLPIPFITKAQGAQSESVGYLVQRDIAAHNILCQYSESELSPSATLQSLRLLSKSDPVEELHMERARSLVEEEIRKDKEAGVQLEEKIFEQLKMSSKFNLKRSTSWT